MIIGLEYLNVDCEDAVRPWRLFVERVSSNGAIRFSLTTTETSAWTFIPRQRIEMPTLHIDNNNNNNNKHGNVYGAVIMAKPLREFTRFIWWM